jgi:hypothetical protein
MKVLQKGRKQNGWAKEKECTGVGHGLGGCGAKLLVEERDIYETGCRGDEGELFRTFKCPECGVETNFAAFELPAELWGRTDRRRPKS